MNIYNKKRNENLYVRIISFLIMLIVSTVFIMYIYDFQFNINTIMFILLLPLMLMYFFLSKDLMHPFNIFFLSSQFLFVFNMIDLNANKEFFRYGTLDNSYREEAFFWSILIIIIWYIFMHLGYIYSKRFYSKPIQTKLFYVHNTKNIALILILIGIVSYIYIVFLKGGFSAIIQGLSDRSVAYQGLNYLTKLTGLITIGAMLLLGEGYKKTSMVLILLSFFMLSSFGGRAGAFFGSIFPYLVYFHYQTKKLNILKLMPIGLVTIIFAIGLGNYRLYQETRIELSGLYDMISDVAYGKQGGEILPTLVGSLIKGDINYQYGSTLINIIFAPIPRTIWTEKPQIDESGIVGRTLMGSDSWGLPPGPYGIAFFNFSFIGVIIVAFIIGFIVYKLYYKFVLSNIKCKTGQVFYILILTSIFNIISTSAQIDLLWYAGIFLLIKLLDILILSLMSKNKKNNMKEIYAVKVINSKLR